MKGKTFLMMMGVLFLAFTVAILPFIGACAPEEEAPPPPPPEEEAPPAPPAPETIKIGALDNMSGPLSALGQPANWGYQTAIDDINKVGGVYVKEFDKKIPLELITIDMEASGEKAVKGMERLYVENVVAAVGETMAVAAVGVAEKNRIPTLIVMSAGREVHEKGFRYWFSPFSKTNDIAKAIFDVLDSVPKDERPAKVAICEEQEEIGIDMCGFFEMEAIARGYDVVAYEKFSRFTKDLSPAILSMKAAGAEVVTGIFMDPDGVTLIKQIKELAFNPKAIAIVQAADTYAWTKALGKDGDYVICDPEWHHALSFPGVAELNAKYQAEFGRPVEIYVGPAYASIQIIADALERAGTLDREKIRDAVVATDMMTVRGTVKFRDDGTIIDPTPVICQWQDGVQELIWPEELRTKPLIHPMPRWEER
jgi:branched-chain amino acid transport system substrate-binding protein